MGALVLGVLLFLGLAALGEAQTMMEMNTAMRMNDTLTGAGGGYAPAPAAMRSQYMNMPAMAAPAPGMVPPPGPMTAMVPAPALAAPVPPPVKRILVLTGERVTCHVMRTLLEDIHYEYRPESEKGEYYDDGTHGDLQPNDNIYTNYSERNDVLSAEANRFKLLYMRMLELCEQTNPIEFFRIPVATEEPLSTLPRLSDEERDRDETFLRQWHSQFLKMYRQDDEDPASDFYPIFVPSPPRLPETPAPPNDQYNMNAYALDAMIQQTVDSAVAPAIEEPTQTTTGGGRVRSSSGAGGESSSYVSGDRWGQLRQDARRYSSTYGAQSSRYFR